MEMGAALFHFPHIPVRVLQITITESITDHYLYIIADGQSWNTFALICSLFCFISIKMYKLNFGK